MEILSHVERKYQDKTAPRLVISIAQWCYQENRVIPSSCPAIHSLCSLVSLITTYLLSPIQITHGDLTKLNKLKDSFLCLLKFKEASPRCPPPHLVLHWTGLVMGPTLHNNMREQWGYYDWWGRRNGTCETEFYQQRKEDNDFWVGNRVAASLSPFLHSVLGHYLLPFMFPTLSV